MKIQEQDTYHGPALMQIVEHPSFKALNRASDEYGHYLINTDRHVFVKYTTKNKPAWQFTFQPNYVDLISRRIGAGDKVFVCLVCGRVTICALNVKELRKIIDLASSNQQTIFIDVPASGSRCHVSGSKGDLPHVVPHNSFPNKLFS